MAKRKVKRERKLLYFMASWCGPCKHLKEYYFDDLQLLILDRLILSTHRENQRWLDFIKSQEYH